MTTYHFFLYRSRGGNSLFLNKRECNPYESTNRFAVLFRRGRLQQYTYRIAVGLHNAGVDTTVLTCSRVLDESGPRVFTLPRLTTVSNTPFSLRWFRSIKRVIDEVDPDVVNGHLPVPYMADVAARVSGDRPFVLTYHNDAWE